MKFKILRRYLVCCMLFSICGFMNTANAANEADSSIGENHSCMVYAADDAITPYADQIITEFRRHNGVLQYRRWNATKGCWVDPDWINVN